MFNKYKKEKNRFENSKKRALAIGLQSDFELSIKNVQVDKEGVSSPSVILKGSPAGMLAGLTILYKEIKSQIPMYEGMLDDALKTLDSITYKYEKVEENIK